MLKLLIDVNVGFLVETWLRENGYDISSVRDLDPTQPDNEILSKAVAEQRIVITLDKDFGELVYKSRLPHAGVLLLRLDTATSREKLSSLPKS